jgi:YcaO-like protein with predicted kinase domain
MHGWARSVAGAPVAERVAKRFWAGTHRSVSPQETVERIKPHMRAMGITRIANVTGLDSIGIPVVMVCRPNSRSLAVSQGKGHDLWAAKASGLMESVESYHAERIDLPLRQASMEQLETDDAVVDASLLPRPSDSPFSRTRSLLWIEGYDLLKEEHCWVPYDAVHADMTVDAARRSDGSFIPTSNGLASGNHLLEAISHAICEVVERDCDVLWWLQDRESRRATRIDLDTVTDPGCRELLDRYAKAEVLVSVWETTSDIGIPAFHCLALDRRENLFRPLYAASGQGCHPARHIALSRALAEAAQSRLTAIAGSRDDIRRDEFAETMDTDALRSNRRIVEEEPPARSFVGPSWDADTLEDDVAWELERLRAVGIGRVVVVDLTKPEFGVPVVRVVIPGLELRLDAVPFRYGPRSCMVLVERLLAESARRRSVDRASRRTTSQESEH